MKLTRIRLKNFQCFGPEPTTLTFPDIAFLLGPGGSGKTAVLLALTRLFGFDKGMRRIQKSDFHVPHLAEPDHQNAQLWIEVDFEFPESKDPSNKHPTIPSNFAHMRLETADGVPRVRFRLDADFDDDGEVQEQLRYVTEIDANDEPIKRAEVSRHDRNSIQVHYVPARRDPSDHISYASTSLLGRVLRAANWSKEAPDVKKLSEDITKALVGNDAVTNINDVISKSWERLHKGKYYAKPEVSFGLNDIEGVLKQLTLKFAPAHDAKLVDFVRLGDGQKSLLYVSLVLAVQDLGRRVLKGEAEGWDVNRLLPAIFSIVAIEEPENSLPPHHLGRIIKSLADFAAHHDAQAIVATHSPSLLRRVAPEHIRYLRLDAQRQTLARTILLPSKTSDAYKFVREGVQAFPELYFSRLVVLGEGDSEEIVIPQLFYAHDVDADTSAISVVPLGGRHVNHFWKLLSELEIPYITLLDLDLARHQGGWGRVRYAANQLLKHQPSKVGFTQVDVDALPTWDGPDKVLSSAKGRKWIADLEKYGVFFSSPLDIDFSMMESFATAYAVGAKEVPTEKTLAAVLGLEHKGEAQYTMDQQRLFKAYHRCFKLGSKPVSHLSALATLSQQELRAGMPKAIARLLDAVKSTMGKLAE